MNTFKEQTSIEQTQLRSGLSQFGLCPNDWKFEPKNNNFVLIKNKM